jgi:hypothetical protein
MGRQEDNLSAPLTQPATFFGDERRRREMEMRAPWSSLLLPSSACLTTKVEVSAKSRGAHAQKEVEADHEIHKNLPSTLASLLRRCGLWLVLLLVVCNS